VPVENAGRTVTAKGSAFFVEVYYRGELLARHDRCYEKHKIKFKLEHYIPLLEERPRAVRNARPAREANLPQDIWDFSLMLEDPDLSMVRLLRLVVDHGPDRVLAAVRKARSLQQFSVDVVGYYVTASDAAPPVPIKGPAVAPVDLACYDRIIPIGGGLQ
jgi:hypothetical protein